MKWFTSLVFLFSVSTLVCQEPLTLQRCLDLAENNSLQIAAESGKLQISKIDRQFHWLSLLPNLTANTGFNTSFGRRLDPFTNTFATSSVNSNSFGLSSGINLFNGLNYFHKRNQFNKTIEIDEIALKAKQHELKTSVIESYLSLCRLFIQLKLEESRREKYEQIRKIQDLLLREGRITVVDTLKSNSALLEEKELLLDLGYETKLKMIELNFLTGLPLGSTYTIDVPSISAVKEKLELSEKFRIESLILEKELLATQLQSDRTAVLPSVSFNALLGTGFSTNNKDYLLPGNPTKLYRDQISQNLYEGIGIYISIPLFDRGEWMKTKQEHAIGQDRLEQELKLTELNLEKHHLELDQKRLINRSKLEQSQRMEMNLEEIYAKSLLLYQEGRLTYIELETALRDREVRRAESGLLKLEIEILNLYE